MKLIVSQILVINNYLVFAIYKSTASIHVHVHVGPRYFFKRQNQYSLIAFLVLYASCTFGSTSNDISVSFVPLNNV